MLSTLLFIHQHGSFSTMREDTVNKNTGRETRKCFSKPYYSTFCNNTSSISWEKQLLDFGGDALHHWFMQFLGIVLHKFTKCHFITFLCELPPCKPCFWCTDWTFDRGITKATVIQQFCKILDEVFFSCLLQSVPGKYVMGRIKRRVWLWEINFKIFKGGSYRLQSISIIQSDPDCLPHSVGFGCVRDGVSVSTR